MLLGTDQIVGITSDFKLKCFLITDSRLQFMLHAIVGVQLCLRQAFPARSQEGLGSSQGLRV